MTSEVVDVPVPLRVRLRFGRAALQVVADEIGADVLHIKGNAADPSLRPGEASGTDVDVLVRPGTCRRARQGPTRSRMARLQHVRLRLAVRPRADLPARRVGIPRSAQVVSRHPCRPRRRIRTDVGRPASRRTSRVSSAASRASPRRRRCSCSMPRAGARQRRSGVQLDGCIRRRTAPRSRQLVDELDAHVAFAAATGDLERFRGERDYRLWKVVSEGGTRSEEWWARVRSAPSLGEALRVAARAPLVNVEHLSIELGRAPTRREITVAFFARPRRMLTEAWAALKHRGGRR